MTMTRALSLKTIVFTAIMILSSPLFASDPWDEPLENIYWGDLHVHTNFSLDAFFMFSSPGRYTDEAGLYALHCAKLDFYSVTDHAEMLTRSDYWEEAMRSAQAMNAHGQENRTTDGDPSIVAFTGWEWTQHAPWGHKNVILKYDDPARLPPSPIRCYRGWKHITGFRPQDWFGNRDLAFLAETPGRLFDLLGEYCTDTDTGCDAVVIPHGNAWGQFTMDTSWDAQLDPGNHDPSLQRLIEVYSKHGNSEEYRHFPPDFRYTRDGMEVDASSCSEPSPCEKVCQEPTESYEPCCWRAGEVVRERCADPDSDFCRSEIARARQTVKPYPDGVPQKQRHEIKPAYRGNPGRMKYLDWGACGQCLDCYQPAFQYNTAGSVQKALASAHFDEDGSPLYYRFGFINSTDTHAARPGSVKEEKDHTEAMMADGGDFLYNVSKKTGIGAGGLNASSPMYGYERIANYLNPGGLVAVLAQHRTRDDLWQSLHDRHVYGTSGPRIDLWLRARVEDEDGARFVRMGDIVESTTSPVFHLKARGAFREDGTCNYDEHDEISTSMSRAEFKRVCFNQCYAPLDERVPIARVEVVKVRQPMTPEEAAMENLAWSSENPGGLIMDPYAVFEFEDPQVELTWRDGSFDEEERGRSLAYYFRVIQKPTPGYSCSPAARLTNGESCDYEDPKPKKVSKMANPRYDQAPIPRDEIEDACYSDTDDEETFCEERAWSSPFYITRQ